MRMSVSCICKKFDELDLEELYNIMALRQQVFIVEQNCPYLDADGKDQAAWHVSAHMDDNGLVGYTRILPVGISYREYCSVGRVVTAPSVRKSGLGKMIMEFSILKCKDLFPGVPVKISAQTYLTSFYEGFGFKSTGNSYLEDDIPHIAMILE